MAYETPTIHITIQLDAGVRAELSVYGALTWSAQARLIRLIQALPIRLIQALPIRLIQALPIAPEPEQQPDGEGGEVRDAQG